MRRPASWVLPMILLAACVSHRERRETPAARMPQALPRHAVANSERHKCDEQWLVSYCQ